MNNCPDMAARSNVRWVICTLLFFATTVNYVDRAVLGILKTTLDAALGWTEVDYGNIVTAFQLMYAAGYLFSGRLIDRIGVRSGFSVAVGWFLPSKNSYGRQRARQPFCGDGLPAPVPPACRWPPNGPGR